MRTETITKNIYTYEELSDSAKETAREWYASDLSYDWWDSVYEDFYCVGAILGLDIDLKKTYFNGFCHQGSGSSYTADYEYKKGSTKEIRNFAPLDKELHRIADELMKGQKPLFYRASGSVETSNRETSVSVRLWDECGDDYEAETYSKYAGHAGLIEEALRDLNNWLYRALEREYEYLTSDECVEESIVANNYEFTEDGKIY